MHIHKVLDTLDITRPGDYEKIEYLKRWSWQLTVSPHWDTAMRQRRESWQRQSQMRSRKELLQIAGTCDQVQEKPARTLRKEIQSMVQANRPVFSWSRMQQATTRTRISIFTHFIRQISRLAVDRGRVQELLDCLWLNSLSSACSGSGNRTVSASYPMFQNVCCGGG